MNAPKSNTRPQLVYTVEQAAEVLALSRASVYRLLQRGELKSLKSGRSRRISTSALEQYVREQEQKRD